jgi:hypothetical protein
MRALIAFLRKVRGPSGCSELLVLSRLMRHEEITLKTIGLVAPWLTAQDYKDVVLSVHAAGLGDLSGKIDSDLFQMVITNGWYAKLATGNEKHFCPDNWPTFERAHSTALAMIEQQTAPSPFPNQLPPIPAAAIAQTAYGLHFLTDGFASGHMRTPRSRLAESGSLLSGVMHDFDNRMGLLVKNGFGETWRAFGDSHLEIPGFPHDSPLNVNRARAVSAVGAAVKQLHYHAQRFFGDSKHPEFQGALGRTRGTGKGLLHDDAVKNSDPGDLGAGRDTWLKMDANAKVNFLKKHRPVPLPVSPDWKSGTGNHPTLVEISADGSLSVDTQHKYYIGQTLTEGKLYELQLSEQDKINFTEEALFALLAPDAARSWLGTKEVWLANVFQKKLVRIDRGLREKAARATLLSALPLDLP